MTLRRLWLPIFFASACSTAPNISSSEGAFSSPVSDGDYHQIVEKFTQSKKIYDGFNLNFEYHATLLTTELVEAQTWLQASDLQWNHVKLQAEREKNAADSAKESKIFLSFFTPVNENDNLEVTGSIWKVFLVSEGTKYEGKVVRTGGILADVQRRYPEHTRFNTPYVVTFAVPTTQIQASLSRLIITGTVGNSEVEFPPAKP